MEDMEGEAVGDSTMPWEKGCDEANAERMTPSKTSDAGMIWSWLKMPRGDTRRIVEWCQRYGSAEFLVNCRSGDEAMAVGSLEKG